MPTSPTQRTLDYCRAQGWEAAVAEYWQSSFSQTAVVQAAEAAFSAGFTQAAIAKLAATIDQAKRRGPGVRVDLFGFIDVVAICEDCITGFQCTSTGHITGRIEKIVSECRDPARKWLATGNKLAVIGWKKYAKAENRRFWRETIRYLDLEIFKW